MDIKNLGKLQQARELVDGVQDIMVFMETAKQDTVIPVGVFRPFQAVLGKVSVLLAEVEEKEKEGLDSGQA